MRSIFAALNKTNDIVIVFPIHPRTRMYLAEYGIQMAPHVRTIEPVGYLDMLELEGSCETVITDSGGVQKEAYFSRKPCITLRDETEWVETVQTGWNRLVGANPIKIAEALHSVRPGAAVDSIYGEGNTGELILTSLLEHTGRPLPE